MKQQQNEISASLRRTTSQGGPQLIEALATLNRDVVIDVKGLALMCSRHKMSIRRAIAKGQLPQPVRLLGNSVWTVGVLLDHLHARLGDAEKQAQKTRSRLSALEP